MVLGEEAPAIPPQDLLVQGAKLGVNLGPNVPKRFSQGPRVTVPEQGCVCVIVEHDQIRPPTHRHRESGVEDHAQH